MRSHALLVLLSALTVPLALSAQTTGPDYQIAVHAEVIGVNALAFPPPGSAYGEDLYAVKGAERVSCGSTSPDGVVRIDASGVATDFAALQDSDDPTKIVFGTPASAFGDTMFVTLNNWGCDAPGFTQGGTLVTVDALGTVELFVDPGSVGYCGGSGPILGEPGGLIIGTGSSFGDFLFSRNSWLPFGDIVQVDPAGTQTVFLSDGLACGSGHVFLDMALSTGGPFGEFIYATNFGPSCSNCVNRIEPNGNVQTFANLPALGFSASFGQGGAFGEDLYVGANNGTLYRIDSSGGFEVFASGFAGPIRGIAFASDGVSAYVGVENTVYRIDLTAEQDPPSNLSCTLGGCTASLTWQNEGAYAAIDVLLDGVTVATLLGNEESTSIELSPGPHEICLVATDALGSVLESTCCTLDLQPTVVLPITDLQCAVDASCQLTASWISSAEHDQVEVTLDGVSVYAGPVVDSLDLGIVAPGSHEVCVSGVDCLGTSSATTCCTVECMVDDPFQRGDCNADGGLDIGDAVQALSILFSSVPTSCLDACDSNDDGSFDIGDPIYFLGYQFDEGPEPPAPFGSCGADPTADTLDCQVFSNCP